MGRVTPNDLRISCRRSCSRPHQTFVPYRATRALRPRGSAAPIRPVGCMRGLGSGAD